MGLMCIKDDSDRYPEKVTCLKCNDKFYDKHGYSQRLSCRVHHYKKGTRYCIYCHQQNPQGNCYHVKKYGWF